MAYIVKRSKNTNTYTTESTGVYNSVRENDSNTISSCNNEYEYYVGVQRRCSRCRMFDWDRLNCKKKKKAEDCRKSYSIKKHKHNGKDHKTTVIITNESNIQNITNAIQ